ncbi:unnamed protein product [Vitrella brassicaformis CCMP3155]|uniref:tRNA pseudouridine synthase n=1 Tax=Vitrella brassicaformis (strain CCMP3155) TaxID=1169540 RepID=A0A0G4FJ41_VITBC|nr:unnamed protein product [Vitrella brassicaformis CCMP3155]|eukprot:CEM13795.1 unnamed protein product [Vitrella brassicaformis CCMP3155]
MTDESAVPAAAPAVLLTVAYDGTDFNGWTARGGPHTTPPTPLPTPTDAAINQGDVCDGNGSGGPSPSPSPSPPPTPGQGKKQRRPKMIRTVEGELRRCVSQLCGGRVQPWELLMWGASRTDAGVHARGQMVQLGFGEGFSLMDGDPQRIRRSLNALLPEDVRVARATRAPRADFHVTSSAAGKEYRYTLDLGVPPDPLSRRYRWAISEDRALGKQCSISDDGTRVLVDWDAVGKAAEALTGTHDFSAFRSAYSGVERDRVVDPVCTVSQIAIVPDPSGHHSDPPNSVQFVFHGNRFLYKMIRRLVGALVEVGMHRCTVDEVRHALENAVWKRQVARGDGRVATSANPPVCAPPHGLVLEQVFYDDAI